MTDFIRYIVKFTCVLLGLLAVLLLLVAGLLLFAPEILFSVLYYAVIIVCLIAAVWIMISLIRILLAKRQPKP